MPPLLHAAHVMFEPRCGMSSFWKLGRVIQQLCIFVTSGSDLHRHLSAHDSIWYSGKAKWAVKTHLTASKQDWILLHIPKNVGDSFLSGSPQIFPPGNRLIGNSEKCLRSSQTKKLLSNGSNATSGNPNRLLFFLRRPEKQVVSQYTECKCDSWGRGVTKGKGFPGYTKRACTDPDRGTVTE